MISDILLIIIILALLFLTYLLIFRYKAPWMPILHKDLIRLDGLFDFQPGQVFYDLGCGDGRVIFYLAKKNPQVTFIGVEISLFFFLYCYVRKIFGRYKNVKIKLNDLMLLDLSQADYIYFYLLNKQTDKMLDKFERVLKNQAVVISCSFALQTWQQYLIKQDKPEPDNISIYIYRYTKKAPE